MTGNAPLDAPAEDDGRRRYQRYKFKGDGFPVRFGKKRFEIRLKDLSAGGACGLMEEPVAVGDFITVELDEKHQVEAQVCWVRRVLVGLQFTRPLNPVFVSRLHDKRTRPPEDAALATITAS
jgi:hypothetical protein